ncbi:2-succinyl-5-enolpyruvyl-6-hydroxy-3-cyclohexene-1-carboxylic-acid synthase [Synechocystis sp. LKSZ1]|uniref:2-succinyl-5-enolpyruvyl-6-hydroxy-3- cyclohexene-1-carboxylic-acid synthase n=1 Tax=Synechocystis sp. LKSZ1 TaxID=3144951 RepID=UPI00336BF9D5
MLDFSNVNSLWSSVLVETLVSLGLKLAVVCPGSRSTPLTVALARHPQLEVIPILDERSAAFFALGRAKRLHGPVVLVCTSGTAAANFFPAIIEAKESQVPLLVLTADRPPHLRHCHAGQTIDQFKLYGAYPQWQTELALPSADLMALQYLRQTLAYAWERTIYPRSGVVHLNCPFTEPLAPIPDPSIQSLGPAFPQANFFRHLSSKTGMSVSDSLIELPSLPAGGLIVAGLYQGPEPETYATLIADLAQGLNYPVLSDALSPLRHRFRGDYSLVTGYDFILRSPSAQAALQPSCVLQIGELPTSKQLRNWLNSLAVPRYILDPTGENFDPLHGSVRSLRCSLPALVAALRPQFSNVRADNYPQQWQAYEDQTQALLHKALLHRDTLAESNLMPHLAQGLPPETVLMVANSMPVRYMEFFWPRTQQKYEIYFNRGANGIDGTLSTALGLAHRDWPTVLLTGDLSLLHDSNGFLLGPLFQGSLTIILVNNQGGGIFEMLPITQFSEVFERYFATPQVIDFAQLCRTYGVAHHVIASLPALEQALALDFPPGIRVWEIASNRREEAQWLQQLMGQFETIQW